MDMKNNKKLSQKEKYRLLTRDLGWEPSYRSSEEVFPYLGYEGIKINDWDTWEDPFRLTMDAYWKYQAEKERKFYAIIDAHAQNNGHLNITDARYLSALKIFLQAISPGEYSAHKGFARVGRAVSRRRHPGRLPDAGHRRDPPRADADPRAVQLQQVLQRLPRVRRTARPHLVHLGGPLVLRRRHVRRAVRVHDRHRLQLRVRADQPAVRAVHVRRRLQRRHGHRHLRLLGAVRRGAAHDAGPGVHQVHARTGPGQPADRPGAGSTSGSGAACAC